MWTWIGIGSLLLVGIYFLNRAAFRRVTDAVNAQIGKGAKSLWSMDPLAVKNAEIDRKANEIADATQGLEGSRALISSVERQVVNGEREVKRLEALSEQFARENNDNKALEKLTELERVQAELDANRIQLKTHRETYNNFLTKIQNANKRILELRKEARSQGARLSLAKAEANLAKLASAVGKANINFDNPDEINQELESQIDKNLAKGQVVHDLSKEGLEEIEAENRARNAAAADKLAALKAKINSPH